MIRVISAGPVLAAGANAEALRDLLAERGQAPGVGLALLMPVAAVRGKAEALQAREQL